MDPLELLNVGIKPSTRKIIGCCQVYFYILAVITVVRLVIVTAHPAYSLYDKYVNFEDGRWLYIYSYVWGIFSELLLILDDELTTSI